MIERYPGVPWVLYEPRPMGQYAMRCDACGAEATGAAVGVSDFARDHRSHASTNPTHYGLGDAVAAVTSAMGIAPCAPCEQRRVDLNQRFPSFWRR